MQVMSAGVPIVHCSHWNIRPQGIMLVVPPFCSLWEYEASTDYRGAGASTFTPIRNTRPLGIIGVRVVSASVPTVQWLVTPGGHAPPVI